jgi:glycosyltransferase involved in cell wall biosynthesis
MNFESFKRKYQKVEVNHYPNRVTQFPKVSVLVQTFNHEFFIRDCLESILMQETDFEFEILLGEDQSSDNTREICIEYAEKYPEKIRLFLHEPGNKIKVLGTTTGNFNAFYNLFSAKGEYIAFCEGDDIWKDPSKLQKQVEYLIENPQYVFTYHNYIADFKEEGVKKNNDLQPSYDISQKDLILNNKHPLLLTICFRNLFSDLPLEIFEVINVDLFLLSLLGNNGKGAYQPELQMAVSRKHPGGIWKSKKRYIQLEIKIHTLKKLEEFYKGKNKEAEECFRSKRKNLAKSLIIKNFRSCHFSSLIRKAVLYYFY